MVVVTVWSVNGGKGRLPGFLHNIGKERRAVVATHLAEPLRPSDRVDGRRLGTEADVTGRLQVAVIVDERADAQAEEAVEIIAGDGFSRWKLWSMSITIDMNSE